MEPTTVLYDEDCGFCRWTADKVRSWDRRRNLAFTSIQSDRGGELLRDVPPGERLRSAHVVTAAGRLRSAGAAVAPVLRELPGGRPLALVAEAFPRTTDRVYRWTAARRTWFGARLGTAACAVDPSAARR